MTPPIDTNPTPARARTMWTAGDYGEFAKYMEPGALQILAGWHIPPGSRMLDVACGAGQISIPAARAGVNVTGVDIAANLIQEARTRAAAEGLSVQFDEGNAEELPYPDASFDTVVSMLGAMFAHHPDRVAAELVRVTRHGGRIIMANWTPRGLAGDTFRVMAKYSPPPANVPLPLLWGDEATVRQRLRDGIRELQLTRGIYPFRFPFGVPEFVEFGLRYNPLSHRAFAALDETRQAALRRDLEEVHSKHNRASDGTAAFEEDYLQVIATRA